QNRGSVGVLLDLFRMLTTVDLNNELCIRTAEINDELVDGRLPSELKSKKSSITQTKPQHAFRIRLITTKAPGATDVPSHHPAPPHPNPLPCGERERTVFVARAQAQKVTDRIHKVGAVHGVEVEVGDAAIHQIQHLLGGDGG